MSQLRQLRKSEERGISRARQRHEAPRQQRKAPAPATETQVYFTRHFLTVNLNRLRTVAALRQQRLQAIHGPKARVTIEDLLNEAVSLGLPALEKEEGL